jgi:SAM-dependent methyltransferase
MTLFKEVLQNSSGIKYDQGVFYDTEIATQNPFHDCYLSLRRTEGRVYTDEIVSQLPDFKSTDNLIEREWKIRAKSAKRLATYLLKKKPRSVLEIGCGNGWLGNFLNRKLKTDYCGVDINQTELLQAAKLFSQRLYLPFRKYHNAIFSLTTGRYYCVGEFRSIFSKFY